jgi:phage N-6-adenine-methyltransferase
LKKKSIKTIKSALIRGTSYTKELWETPPEVFDPLDAEFHFDLDAAATKENAKCKRFISPGEDALMKDTWIKKGTIWLNPPYGRNVIEHWLGKAFQQCLLYPVTIVCLIPASTDTIWWHRFVMKAYEIRFVRGRIKFELRKKKHNTPLFPSAIIVFKQPLEPGKYYQPIVSTFNPNKDKP